MMVSCCKDEPTDAKECWRARQPRSSICWRLAAPPPVRSCSRRMATCTMADPAVSQPTGNAELAAFHCRCAVLSLRCRSSNDTLYSLLSCIAKCKLSPAESVGVCGTVHEGVECAAAAELQVALDARPPVHAVLSAERRALHSALVRHAAEATAGQGATAALLCCTLQVWGGAGAVAAIAAVAAAAAAGLFKGRRSNFLSCGANRIRLF